VEVTIDNLNDNVDKQFLAKEVQKYGDWEELKIEYHPITKKHLGKSRGGGSKSMATGKIPKFNII
jgi:histone-lysine N-methyltransferase SETD1